MLDPRLIEEHGLCLLSSPPKKGTIPDVSGIVSLSESRVARLYNPMGILLRQDFDLARWNKQVKVKLNVEMSDVHVFSAVHLPVPFRDSCYVMCDMCYVRNT